MVHQEANRQIWNSDTAHGQGKRHVPLWPPPPPDRYIQDYTKAHTGHHSLSHLTYWQDCRPTQGLPSGRVYRKAGVCTYYSGAFLSLGIGA